MLRYCLMLLPCCWHIPPALSESSSRTILEPAPVSLPETYAPPMRSEVESILGAALTVKSNATQRPLHVVLCASEKDEGHSMTGMHDYPLWRERWLRLLTLAEGVTVETADIWPTAEQWRRADIVVVNSYNPAWALEAAGSARIDALEKDLDSFLARGGGLAFIHYALNAGPNAKALAARLGLAWRGVPPYSRFRHDATEWQLNKAHPLAVGLPELKVPDESYWNLAGDLKATDAGVLLSSVEDGASRPQMWTREVGKGRVFVSIPGHSTWTYDDPIYRIFVFRGMMWTVREPMDRLAPLVPVGARFGGKDNSPQQTAP